MYLPVAAKNMLHRFKIVYCIAVRGILTIKQIKELITMIKNLL